MPFAIVREHRNFFRKHRWIEFEDLLSRNQLHILSNETPAILAKRLQSTETRIHKFPPQVLFQEGRDLWRESKRIKKILLNKTLGEVVGETLEIKPLRFGYAQLFPTPSLYLLQRPYAQLLSQTLTLQEISCIQGVLGGLMLCLPLTENHDSSSNSPLSTIFAQKPGNGVLFAPDMPIPFSELSQRENLIYLLLVYTQENAVYCLKESDPHTHDFKRLGYHLGDRLTEALNPLVYV